MAEIEAVEAQANSNKSNAETAQPDAGKNAAHTDPIADRFTPAREVQKPPVTEPDGEDNFRLRNYTEPPTLEEKRENARQIMQRRVISPTVNTFTAIRNGITYAVNQTVVNPYNAIMGRIIDISDRIAAVIGEKEKDVREKLSDNLKQVEEKIYNLMEKVDTTMEQKDHHREKKTKDPEKLDPETASRRIDNEMA